MVKRGDPELRPEHHSSAVNAPNGRSERATDIAEETLDSDPLWNSLSAHLREAFDLNSSYEQPTYGRPYRSACGSLYAEQNLTLT
jgi:hypothetical protein